MQIPVSGQQPLSIPVIQEFLTIAFALVIGAGAFLGLCWGLSYVSVLILAHTTSTQMLFMCLIGFGLIYVARRYLQRGKK